MTRPVPRRATRVGSKVIRRPPQVVTTSRTGVEVVGLRIDLVEGDLARVDLAVSQIKIGTGVIRR